MEKKIDKKLQGKRNREAGARFERKTRLDLEKKGWIVDRWNNNVELPTTIVSADCKESVKIKNKGKLVPAKSTIFRSNTHGFPDFYIFKKKVWFSFIDLKVKEWLDEMNLYEVIGVECKSNGYLNKEERKKCDFLLKNNIFSKILVAKKGKKRGEIKYNEFI